MAEAHGFPRPAGDARFDQIVGEHWHAVYKLLYRLSGDLHETEDLTQETFLRALSKLESFAPGTSLRAWLLRIATNAFFDVRRKRKRAGAQPLVVEPCGASEPPDRRLEMAEQGELIRASLEELTELTRLVFHLRVDEDLSFKEIADMTGTTEQSARWHMFQARSKLLKRLGKISKEA